jgi:hypothetical protein
VSYSCELAATSVRSEVAEVRGEEQDRSYYYYYSFLTFNKL